MVEINLEEGMPIVTEAMDNLKIALKRAKESKTKVVVFIHGYGSSGKGGAICKNARQWLKAQERNGTVKSVVEGENFDMFNAYARNIKAKDSQTVKYYGRGNNGITLVEL
jgi:hypothetical protein